MHELQRAGGPRRRSRLSDGPAIAPRPGVEGHLEVGREHGRRGWRCWPAAAHRVRRASPAAHTSSASPLSVNEVGVVLLGDGARHDRRERPAGGPGARSRCPAKTAASPEAGGETGGEPRLPGLYCGGVSTQVTIVGGGSYQWAPELMADLFGTPALAGMHLVLEDIDPAPLPKMEALAHKLNDAMGAKATVATTTDLDAGPRRRRLRHRVHLDRGLPLHGGRPRRAGRARHHPDRGRHRRARRDQPRRCATSPSWSASARPWRSTAPTPGSSTSPTR